MTEEIKEILDKLKINETTGMCYLSIRLTNQIRSIITYLQQENEILKYENALINDRNNNYRRTNEYYKSRLEKASNKLDSMFANGEENKILDDLLELDKIIKGDKQ